MKKKNNSQDVKILKIKSVTKSKVKSNPQENIGSVSNINNWDPATNKITMAKNWIVIIFFKLKCKYLYFFIEWYQINTKIKNIFLLNKRFNENIFYIKIIIYI